MKVKIKDFQSISEADLEFDIGITTIVGPSNSGKTSIVRAITSAITNTSDAKSFIQYGKKKTEVTLDLDYTPTVEWSRTEKESSYTIGGEEHQKVGKVGLLDLTETNLITDDEDNILNIQDEWSVLFPFDRTPSAMYKLFESTFDINDSSVILKKIKEDTDAGKKEINRLANILAKTTHKVGVLDNWLSTSDIEKLTEDRDLFNKVTSEYIQLLEDIKSLNENIQVLKHTKTVKKFEIESKGTIEEFLALEQDIKYLEANVSVLDYTPSKLSVDADIIKDFISLSEDCKALKEDIPKLTKKISKFDLDSEVIKEYLEIKADSEILRAELQNYKNGKAELDECKAKLAEIAEELKEFKICPLCGSEAEFGKEHHG